jgi:putative phosphoesterase
MDNAENPRAQVSTPLPPGDAPPCTLERILHEIASRILVAREAPCVTPQGRNAGNTLGESVVHTASVLGDVRAGYNRRHTLRIRPPRDASMIVGIVSDIHCNIDGFRQALTAMGPIDHLICLGDSIYEYRFSNEVVALLREYDADVILGNHEEVFFSPHGERARQAPWIDRSHLEWLRGRPSELELTLAGRKLRVVHSTPWTPRGDYIFPQSPMFRRFGDVDADYVFYGHTHMQTVTRVGRPLVINPGSAGEARNGMGLSCAVLDLAADEAQIVNYS